MASPEEMIQNILSDPDAMNKISDMLSSITSDGKKEETTSPSLPFEDPAMIFKITEMIQKLNGEDDNNTKLITALKPYLSHKRAESADKAIKFMKLSKMSSLLQDINLF